MDKNRIASEQILLDKIGEMPEPARSGPFCIREIIAVGVPDLMMKT